MKTKKNSSAKQTQKTRLPLNYMNIKEERALTMHPLMIIIIIIAKNNNNNNNGDSVGCDTQFAFPCSQWNPLCPFFCLFRILFLRLLSFFIVSLIVYAPIFLG